MYLIFDFDGTLFSMKPLSQAWCRALEEAGYAREDIADARRQAIQEGFCFRLHGELLGVPDSVLDPLVEAFEQQLEEGASQWVFRDVPEFLRASLPSNRHTVLTRAEPEFQTKKIQASGLFSFFHGVTFATPGDPKAVQIRQMVEAGGEPFVYFEDNPKELLAVHEAGLPVSLIRVRRANEHHSEMNGYDDVLWRCISTFDELANNDTFFPQGSSWRDTAAQAA